jgi:uncharacterized membrane protein
MGWADLWQTPLDTAGLVLFVLFFPVYQLLRPWLRRVGVRFRAGKRVEREIESWVDTLLEDGKAILGVQQTRNTTMVATLLASSSIIMVGMLGNLALRVPESGDTAGALIQASGLRPKLALALVAAALAFSSFLSCLGRFGKFTVSVGVKREVLDRMEGSGVTYLTALFLAAVHSYRTGVRWLYAIFPLVAWLFSPWLFIAVTVGFGLKFVVYEDFIYLVRRRRRGAEAHNLSG